MPPNKPTPPKQNQPIVEKFFEQVSDSLQLVFDLYSRIDERVKISSEKLSETDEQVDKFIDLYQSILNRLVIIEAKDYSGLKEEIRDIGHQLSVFQNENYREITDLKNKIHALELKIGTHDNRWEKILDNLFKLGLMLIAGYILFKLGFQAPPL